MKGIKFLLSDLDGVIRHFSAERDQEIEQRCGLSQGALLSAAFEKNLLTRAITGLISDEAWRVEIADSISKFVPTQLAAQAVNEWSAFPGKVDGRYLGFLKKQFPELPIAILTNGTSRLHKDLKTLGISDRFYKVFNSAEIGFCKPDKNVYLHVVETLDCKASEIFFIDDSISHVNAAKELGMMAHHYRSFDDFQIYIEAMACVGVGLK